MVEALEFCLEGIPLSQGIAIGKPILFSCSEMEVEEVHVPLEGIKKEIVRYRKALEKASQELLALKRDLEQAGQEESAQVIDAHLQMAKDPLLTKKVEEGIYAQQKNAEFVL